MGEKKSLIQKHKLKKKKTLKILTENYLKERKKNMRELPIIQQSSSFTVMSLAKILMKKKYTLFTIKLYIFIDL